MNIYTEYYVEVAFWGFVFCYEQRWKNIFHKTEGPTLREEKYTASESYYNIIFLVLYIYLFAFSKTDFHYIILLYEISANEM
jgi:hypothetical protein